MYTGTVPEESPIPRPTMIRPSDQYFWRAGFGAGDGAGCEDNRRGDQQSAAAKQVRQAAAKQSAHGRAREHAADNKL